VVDLALVQRRLVRRLQLLVPDSDRLSNRRLLPRVSLLDSPKLSLPQVDWAYLALQQLLLLLQQPVVSLSEHPLLLQQLQRLEVRLIVGPELLLMELFY
jgi:hypothetical protein